MSALFSKPTAAVFIEITEQSVHIANDARSLELPLDREANGALKAASAETFRSTLQIFGVQNASARQAFCLLPARGVSVRRIALPASSREDVERLMPLQIDAQFPVSSEELAWGFTPLAASIPSHDGAPLKEFLVAAVKKETLQQYREIISGAGFTPLFAISALARQGLCSLPPSRFGLLEIGQNRSELLTLDESGPATLRVLALGGEGDLSTEPLLSALRKNGSVEKIFVTGKSSAVWSARIAPNIPSEPLAIPTGQSSAIAGLRETLRRGQEPLLIQAAREPAQVERAPTAQWRWAALAAVLAVISFALRYAEPALRRSQVAKTMTQLRDARAKLPNVEHELAFLQFIKTNQPGYLEVINALANASPPGTTFSGITLSRRGDVSLRGMAQSPQETGNLRSKMIDSGFFSNVTLDEQTPGQNRQVTFRMSAQLRPESERKTPPKSDAKSAATNKTSAVSTNKGGNGRAATVVPLADTNATKVVPQAQPTEAKHD